MLMRALRRMLTMMFAIEEINQSTKVLPNITLGYLIYDVCRTMHTTLDATLNFLQEMIDNDVDFHCKPSAVIGPSQSGMSSAVAQFLGLFYIPQIGYSSSCKCLSDKKKFPSFLRTIPSDSFQAFAVAKLVNYFAWLYVGTIEVSRDYGRVAIDQFTFEAEKMGICIAFREILPAAKDIDGLINLGALISKSNADIILVFGGEADIPPLARELLRRNITSKMLIASEAWITSPFFLDPTFIQVYRGTIGFALQHGVIPGLKSFLLNFKPYTDKKNLSNICINSNSSRFRTEKTKRSLLSPCTGLERPDHANSTLTDVTQLRVTYNTYIAVYITAHALHKMGTCDTDKIIGDNVSCPSINSFEHWQLLQYIRNVNFINDIGELVNFDENGDPPARYELLNWQMDLTGKMRFKVVGAFDSSLAPENQLKVNETDIKWYSWNNQVPISICNKPCSPGTRKFARKGEPFCCFDCIPCAPGEFSNTTGPPRPFRNTSTSPGTIILECAGAAPAWAVCGLLQIALLASICLGLASKAGKMPSAANEVKFISFSMIAFFLLCFCFVPAYFSTQGKLSVVTQVFSIIATAYAFLGCIFLPKCYYIFKCKRHM
uniref:extracellular calcium-sensing receptor-like n=1 Tax=Myxine glutinosa TaxID=7769 RepID=UPI00358EAF14